MFLLLMTVIRTSDLENVNNPSITSSLLIIVANIYFLFINLAVWAAYHSYSGKDQDLHKTENAHIQCHQLVEGRGMKREGKYLLYG